MREPDTKQKEPAQKQTSTAPSHKERLSGQESNPVLQLQRSVGNQAVMRLLQPEAESGANTSAAKGDKGSFGSVHPPIKTSSRKIGSIQTKLTVNKPGDAYEQEADRVSEQVMRMADPGATAGASAAHPAAGLQRQCDCGGTCDDCRQNHQEEKHGLMQMKEAGPASTGGGEAPPIVREVLSSPGQPLDKEIRAFMEPRFGRDFSNVKVHTDAKAAESAKAVRAKAYTVGQNVVFGEGQYQPGTDAGQRLMSHELAHVVQQQGGMNLIQRRETDDRSCAGLKDIESDIDTEVNKEINAARTAVGPSGNSLALAAAVFKKLGDGVFSPIEIFVENLGVSKRNLPAQNLAGTKYSGADKAKFLYSFGTKVVGSSANMHGMCIGADKLGHFFDLGFQYWAAFKKGVTTTQIEELGRGTEIGKMGLALTGVYSNADLAANRAGLQFYKDLEADPAGLNFALKNYITNQWSEQVNPSFYEPALGEVVWGNLLTGHWLGTITGPNQFTTSIQFDLAASSSSVNGSYELLASGAKPNKGKINGGKIAQVTTAVSGNTGSTGMPTNATANPVSGVKIEFDWQRGTLSGKGVLNSANEQTLNGTWGYGTSSTNGGNLSLNKA